MDRRHRNIVLASAAVAAIGLTMSMNAQTPAEIQQAVDAAYAKFRTLQEGKNADYIPALAKVDPNLFGIAVVTADGKVYTAGDVKTEVSIQSISKVFTMAQVIEEQGLESVEKQIGVDATGARFNSIIAVEAVRTVVGSGAPEMNPLVNPGAISATSMVSGRDLGRGVAEDHRLPQRGRRPPADRAAGRLQVRVGHQPAQPGDRRAHAGLRLHQEQLAAGGRSLHPPVLDRRQRAGPRDHGGHARRRRPNPVSGKQVMDASKVPGVLAVMATAGLYDDSGKWLYHTGLPAKSGVGGGIIAVSPGKFGIAVVSPPLDDAGNSIRAQRAIADISNALGGNPYAPRPK